MHHVPIWYKNEFRHKLTEFKIFLEGRKSINDSIRSILIRKYWQQKYLHTTYTRNTVTHFRVVQPPPPPHGHCPIPPLHHRPHHLLQQQNAGRSHPGRGVAQWPEARLSPYKNRTRCIIYTVKGKGCSIGGHKLLVSEDCSSCSSAAIRCLYGAMPPVWKDLLDWTHQ